MGNCNSNRFSTDFAELIGWATTTATAKAFPRISRMTADRHPQKQNLGEQQQPSGCVSPKVFLPLQLSIRYIREIRGKAVAVAVAHPIQSSKSVKGRLLLQLLIRSNHRNPW
jgi:hypothetical protein